MADIPFPFEIVIEGTPISLQGSSSSKARWQNEVSGRTRVRLNDVIEWYYLDERPVAVTIFYFPIATMNGDLDNIVKPILDGLKAVAYPDDSVVERILVQKFEPGIPRSFRITSAQLGKALDAPPPVVYIRLDDDLSWRQLP